MRFCVECSHLFQTIQKPNFEIIPKPIECKGSSIKQKIDKPLEIVINDEVQIGFATIDYLIDTQTEKCPIISCQLLEQDCLTSYQS